MPPPPPSSMSTRVPALLLSGALLLGLGLLLTKRNRLKRPSLASSKMIRLQSSDGKIFEVEESAAILSQEIKNLIEAGGANDVIPLPRVTGEILSMIIEYCRMHPPNPNIGYDFIRERELLNWDSKFVDVNNATLLDLILAALYLDINCLLDLACWYFAQRIRGKTPEEFRRIFNLKNEFSLEELE